MDYWEQLEAFVETRQVVTVKLQYARFTGYLYRFSSYRVFTENLEDHSKAFVSFLPRDVADIQANTITLKEGEH